MSNSTLQPKDFFISYTGRDLIWAEWIAWVLEEAGYSVVIRKWDFRPGGNFILDTQQATESNRTIAILSSLYLANPSTQAEWSAVFSQDPAGQARKLIPVKIEEFTPPGLLASISYIDLFNCVEFEAQERLLKAAQDLRMKPNDRPRFPGQAKAPFPGFSNQTSLKTTRQQVSQENSSISAYLNNVIRPLPNDQIFDEKKPLITLKDIYVQPNIRNPTLDDAANSADETNSTDETKVLNLHNWIKVILEKQDSSRKVIFVSGEAGRGKTAFCKMFANWVVDQEKLNFIPILVELRQIRVLESNLKKTLENCLQTFDFIQDNPKWLTERSFRFLFLLDGLDELFLQESEEAEEFLEQVINFQRDRNHNHQCLITGRPLSVTNLDKDDFYWCQIEPMDDQLREQWLMNWELSFGEEETSGLRNFIRESPEDIKSQLLREPLLLYLLARLHREKHISSEMFSQTKGVQAKIRIYRECINWVLEQQARKRSIKAVGLSSNNLRNLMREIALCITQSGAEVAKFSILKSRIEDCQDLISFIKQVDDRTKKIEKISLNNLLAAFYLKPADKGQQGSIEFTHKSFGEFLFAERLKTSFNIWVSKSKGQYIKDAKQIHEEIYDLLGYGSLSREIVDYLIALLTEDGSFKLDDLFERLYDFYLRWCDEEYIENWTDEQPPRSKMLELRGMLVQVSLRQVDVYAGLNVMILLFELHRYARQQNKPIKELNFHPCGQPETQSVEEADSEKLLRIVGYSYCIHKKTEDSMTRRFIDNVGHFLSYANLASANLQSVNFSGVDLQFADLSNAVLVRADLSGAILIETILQGADLSGADLRGSVLRKSILNDKGNIQIQEVHLQKAVLSDANLTGLDLSGLDLSEVDLSGLNLSGFDLSNVDLRNAILNGVNLTNANLSGADLSGLDLTEYNLVNVNLSNATLDSTELVGANLRGADLSGLNLYEFDLRDVDLREAQLMNANLRKAILDDADLTGAKISEANLALASLDGTNFRGADLSNSNLSGAYLRNANLTEANLENIQCEGTKWEGVIGLELARNLPDEAKAMLIA